MNSKKMSKSYKLKIDKNLEKQIRHLCNKLPATEYSGTLFYTVTGSFENDDIEFTAVDFFLQDIGDSTFTSFENESEFASYMLEHDLLDCYTGLMHSHHTMSTFFSGTDMGTLNKEGEQRTHFLSLIVNNAGVYNAFVTKKVNVQVQGKRTSSYETYNGNSVIEDVEDDIIVEDDYLEYYPLTIEVETVENDMTELDNRFDEIKTRKADAKKLSHETYHSPYTEKSYTPYTSKYIEVYDKDKDDDKKDSKELYLPFSEYYEEDDTPMTDKQIEDTANKIFKQMVTLDMFAEMKTSIDLKKWLPNMKRLFDKRFGDSKSFEPFAEIFLEGLLDLDVKTTVDNYYAIIEALVHKCEKNSNEYMDVYKTLLKLWLLKTRTLS